MNPAHTSPEPGLAPCGMKLEPVYAGRTATPWTLSVPRGGEGYSQKRQLLGVRVAPVGSPLHLHVTALGEVAVDEPASYRLDAAVDGWIRDLFDNSTGMVVKKDRCLATFYRPAFLAPQNAYVCAFQLLRPLSASGSETLPQILSTRGNVHDTWRVCSIWV